MVVSKFVARPPLAVGAWVYQTEFHKFKDILGVLTMDGKLRFYNAADYSSDPLSIQMQERSRVFSLSKEESEWRNYRG